LVGKIPHQQELNMRGRATRNFKKLGNNKLEGGGVDRQSSTGETDVIIFAVRPKKKPPSPS